MTLKEAKKILEKEFVEIGFHKSTEPFEFDESRWFVGEKPEVLDAFRVLSREGYYIAISGHDYDMRKARLGRPTDKPSSDTPSTLNPALKESASQFNDALLDEQAKEIERLKKENAESLGIVERMKQDVKEVDYKFNAACKENERLNEKIRELIKEKSNLEDQITVLNACKKHNDKIDRKQIKCLGKEIAKLNGIIHGKNAILSDVAEELRLTKIREKNLTEVGQKYMKEVEDLREKLANKVVDKIDAQALKSAESALAYKDSYIEKLKNKKVINNRASMEAIAKYVDAVSKAELDGLVLESWKNDGKEITSVYQLKNGKRYTLSLVYTGEEFLFYKTDLDKKPHISTPEISQEELMKIQEKVVASCDIAEEGGDHSAIIVQCYKDITTISKDEADIIERCTKNGTELHYSEKDGFTYTNMYGKEMPIRCLRGMFHVFTDEEIKKYEKVSYGRNKQSEYTAA